MSVYMKVDGVPGESEADGYLEWIELTHANISMSMPMDESGTAFKVGTVTYSPVYAGSISVGHVPALINKQAKGAHFPKVEIHQVVTDDGNKPLKVWILEDVTFGPMDHSCVAQQGVGGGNFTIAYAKIEMKQWIIPTKGASPVSKGSIIYDAKQKKVLS